jgi:pimeloyl-ACP methyl ester carboxylesterase
LHHNQINIMKKCLLLIAIVFVFGCTNNSLVNIISYQAGFKVVRTTDRSRIYKPGTDTSNYLHYRPIDIDVWYPAKTSQTDTTLNFKYFLDLFGNRANYYTASKAGDSLPNQFAKAFCEGFKCSTPAQLFALKTSSYKNAAPANGKFPVVVYMASYNGMGYENYILLENLAKKGYVVVSINSIGRYPGDMSMKDENMMEQTNDAVAALKHLANSPEMDFSKVAILGYSWGGVAGAVLADKIPDVKCLISFEGSEFHHYNSDKNEDADFDGIKNSVEFKKMALTIPYLRFESSPPADNKKDSVYNFTEKLSKNRLILKVDSAGHEDFSALPVATRNSGKCRNTGVYNTVSDLTLDFIEDHLQNKQLFPAALAQVIDKKVKEVK